MMQALSGDAFFIDAVCAGRFDGFVHSVFDKAVNLRCRSNGILHALVCRRLDNGPDTLVVDVDRFAETEIEAGDAVRSSGGVLRIGDTAVVGFDEVAVWDGALYAYPADTARLKHNLERAEEYLSRRVGKSDGDADLFTRETARRLERSGASLVRCLARGDREEALAHAADMIGLGPGLTPAGDDFLLGVCAVLHIENSPCFYLREFSRDVTALSYRFTNEISHNIIVKASKGKFREKIVDAVNNFQSNDEDVFFKSIYDVFSIGASSGTYVLKGIIGGLEMNVSTEEARSWH